MSFLKRFYAKHPIISHLCLIALAAVVLGWLSLIFLGIWTRHGSTAVVPDIRKMTYDDARAVLAKEGFKVEISDSVYNDSIPAGIVIESWPRPGAVVKPRREVYLTVAAHETRVVTVTRAIENISSRQALAYLDSLGLKNVHIEFVPAAYADLVVGATCKGRMLQRGDKLPINSRIQLLVGNGEGNAQQLDDEEMDEENAAGGEIEEPASPADPDDPYQSSFYD